MTLRKTMMLSLLTAVGIGILSVPAYGAGWAKEGEESIYLNEDGSKAIGWIQDQGKWYYFQEDGWMVNGWVPYEGNWYYMTEDGSMAVNTTVGYYRFDENGIYTPSVPTVADPADNGHNYYKGLSQEQAAEADLHAQLLASMVLNDPSNDTDLKKVQAAAQLINMYCSKPPYEDSVEGDYRSPYGVFVTKSYSCAGETRALGRVLDFMGFSWTHKNENQGRHQWVVVTMDGQIGYADPQGAYVGYGEYWTPTI